MLVIFDCDGVLVDSEPLANASFSRGAQGAGPRLVGRGDDASADGPVAEVLRRDLRGRARPQAARRLPREDAGGDLPELSRRAAAAGRRREGGRAGAAGGRPRHLRRKLGLAGEDALHARPHRPVGPVRRPHLQLEPGAARQAVSRSLPACRDRHERAAVRLRRRRGFGARRAGGARRRHARARLCRRALCRSRCLGGGGRRAVRRHEASCPSLVLR